ncbi:uncharacterized protein ASCRUDRAFT_102840 [Ascoidea rubescens DSM 1968]|uniref:Uncharacterized protein n=1 Tax=Ascoidea rubescens DSM 1968 TaxID=1344418 RepID=A0A1D2VRE3_9ASCO|nr:hypothetical protein ASCRUDRAFT_102840 [Ascoidea rubescens DSM 1968]ODV64137.1 hypothetical protein ASCRUDRAFT_102840 [Ascoidea rubescens DSM 1968]
MKIFHFNSSEHGNSNLGGLDSSGGLENLDGLDVENQFNSVEMELIEQRISNNRKNQHGNKRTSKKALSYDIFIPRFINSNNKMFYYIFFLMVVGLVGIFLNFGLGIRLSEYDEETEGEDSSENYIDNSS